MAGAPESPWALPVATFAARARQQWDRPYGPSYDAAREALPLGGAVLDVGAGVGAASLALHERAGAITAVDQSATMLADLADLAASHDLEVSTIVGRWPDVAASVAPADVVVCHHVLYNVPDIGDFVEELTAHARHRVVVEISSRHPQAVFNPLWMSLHGLARPDGPVAADAVAAIAETGVRPRRRVWRRPVTEEGTSWPELIESASRRLCVGPDARERIEAALRAAGASPEYPHLGTLRELVTIWWDVDDAQGDVTGTQGEEPLRWIGQEEWCALKGI